MPRGTLLPDPRYDALRCVVLAAADDAEDMGGANLTARVLVFDDKQPLIDREGLPNVQARARRQQLPCPAWLCPHDSFCEAALDSCMQQSLWGEAYLPSASSATAASSN